jgi:hypothetical protein
MSSLLALLPLLFLFSVDTPPQQDPIVAVALVTKCKVSTPNGAISFRSITAIGRRTDLLRLIRSRTLLDVHDCESLLEAGDPAERTYSRLARVPNPRPSLPVAKGKVYLHFADAAEFAALFNALRSAPGGAPPRGGNRNGARPPSPPSGGSIGRLVCADGASACAPAADVDIAADGPATFTVGCENGLQVEASTSGDVNVRLKSGAVSMTVPVVRASQ